ncbi:MAG: 23S rRNA (guanosine(2251)-2'-O)-methyltransferase RlmB [Deltaproteobacteria bacterium]|nr:23S rRNA (guanosine(2251)-2'-O)-methyltransferase RlmB [Deltaproteobacteria bacterium]MBM4317330.1 23S rRNA (guanosine(2251)-2'-O)-methyltransferase RlmB [Deltaproteobacteria bacterium]
MNSTTSLSAISHLLQHRSQAIKKLIVFVPREKASSRIQSLLTLAEQQGIAMDYQPTPKQKSLEPLEPLLAQLRPYPYADWKEFLSQLSNLSSARVLALDHLQDPQNFGALCRTAEGLGWNGVIIPKDRSVTVTSGVYNASVGAIETLSIAQITNLAEALRKLKDAGFWIVGTALGENSQTLEQLPPIEKIVLVLGTELEGISSLVAKTCDFLVRLPLAGKVQSLNVSATGAILMNAFKP